MSHDDPLEEWLIHFNSDLPAKRLAELRAQTHTGLEELNAFLDHPPKRANLWNARLGMWSKVGLERTDLVKAQELYRRVYTTGGSGNYYMSVIKSS